MHGYISESESKDCSRCVEKAMKMQITEGSPYPRVGLSVPTLFLICIWLEKHEYSHKLYVHSLCVHTLVTNTTVILKVVFSNFLAAVHPYIWDLIWKQCLPFQYDSHDVTGRMSVIRQQRLVEPSHQYSITFCGCAAGGSRGAVQQNGVWHGSADEAKVCRILTETSPISV